jgi:CheY-like chemotaxis protein
MPYRLLVMDDSVTIRRVVELTFAGDDVQVVSVGDGRAAMERIVAEPPDVILADVGTSQPDGYEVSAYVKGNEALSHIPVLLLSGAFQPIDEERALASRCDGVLSKPFDPEAVATRVRGLLGAPSQPTGPQWGQAAVPAHDLIAFFERLLAEPASPGPGAERADPQWERADGPARHEGALPPTGGDGPFSLDDYFDLVDDLLSRSRQLE